MHSNPNDQSNASPLVVTLADVARDLTPERCAGYESSYRRGCHQMAALCTDIASQAKTLPEARRMLRRTEALAGKLRFIRKGEGRGMLLDHIRQRIYRPARKGDSSK